MIKLFNKKTKQSLEIELDVLLDALILSIEKLLQEIDEVKEDLADLTDFVEDNLD